MDGGGGGGASPLVGLPLWTRFGGRGALPRRCGGGGPLVLREGGGGGAAPPGGWARPGGGGGAPLSPRRALVSLKLKELTTTNS